MLCIEDSALCYDMVFVTYCHVKVLWHILEWFIRVLYLGGCSHRLVFSLPVEQCSPAAEVLLFPERQNLQICTTILPWNIHKQSLFLTKKKVKQFAKYYFVFLQGKGSEESG